MQLVCDFCGTSSNRVHKIRGTGQLQCRACYLKRVRQDTGKSSVCSVCGKLCYAEYRTKQNERICQICSHRAKINCWVCGKLGTYRAGRCRNCYESDRRKVRKCAKCKRVFEYRYDSTTICRNCVKKHEFRPRGICSKCKRSKVLSTRLENGGRICNYCYKKYFMKHTPCEICQKVTFCFKNNRLGKSICIQCGNKFRYRNIS